MIKGDEMTQSRLELDDYTARVLDVIKGKFGLSNRSEALKRFALENGDAYVEPVPNDRVLKEIDAVFEQHIKEHKARKLSERELDRLLGI